MLILAALPAMAAPAPTPCGSNSDARQLDYWLGDWSVGTPGAPNTGHSKVFLSLDKCLLTESWGSDTSNHQGENAMAYNPDDKTWHGLFVDNRGRVHLLKGRVAPGSAEFQGASRDESGNANLTKVKIVRVNRDNVEQIWQKSSDNGASWSTDVRMQYSRKRL